MIALPPSTVYGKRIPKQRFYENLSVTSRLKRVFVEQIQSITWQNVLAASTVHVAPGKAVEEIEVIGIQLNQPAVDMRVLQLVDKEIPYHILFLLEYGEEVQAWIAYKEKNKNKPGTFKAGVYYHTEWMAPQALSLRIEGLHMDMVYENLVRQVAGERLAAAPGMELGEAVARDEQRQKLQREISALENKVRREKQFNLQVELNSRLKRLKTELEAL